MNLSSYRGTNRVLIFFAPSVADPAYERQEELLRDSEREAGFKDRDPVRVRVFTDGGGPVSAGEAAGLREGYGVGEGRFAVILVGKDGTEKSRWEEPVSAGEVFERIDAMPMRRREMEEG